MMDLLHLARTVWGSERLQPEEAADGRWCIRMGDGMMLPLLAPSPALLVYYVRSEAEAIVCALEAKVRELEG